VPHESNSQNTRVSYACLPLFSLHFSCPTNQPNELGYSHTLINAPSASSCLLYTLSISYILICSTRYYRLMSAVELIKVSSPVTKANFCSEFFQTVFSSISGFISIYHRARIMGNKEWFLINFFSFLSMNE
jgi:hypothetical protein